MSLPISPVELLGLAQGLYTLIRDMKNALKEFLELQEKLQDLASVLQICSLLDTSRNGMAFLQRWCARCHTRLAEADTILSDFKHMESSGLKKAIARVGFAFQKERLRELSGAIDREFQAFASVGMSLQLATRSAK